VRSGQSARQLELFLAGLAAALGLLAFSAWFAHHGQKKTALVTGGLASAMVVLLLVAMPPWHIRRGINESYEASCRYGGDRGELELGHCEVTIPSSHREGELEGPSILHLELRARPDRHVMLQQVVPQNQQDFYDAVQKSVQQTSQRDLFVFVHGFNVSFEAAARRTAQIAHDLHFAGAPIFFSWPSQAKTWRYTVDETNVIWAVPHLKSFLTELALRSNAQSIHLIAHSMGNRALTQAIYELGYECKQERKLFQQVILAAPDIDADVFRQQIAPALARYSSRVTLYTSANDEALAASKLVHGSRRAGESVSQPVTVTGVETIDVATTDLGPLGHSYYGSCPLILQDLSAILREAHPAALRPWLAPVNIQGSMYWRLSDTAGMATSPVSLSRPIR
jgi:esterase/lipase superfamily enzyme